MEIEIRILDWIQSLRTPIGDLVMPVITSLGNVGILWILLAVILLLVPKTRKSGVILLVSLCVEVVFCSGILKNIFRRVRPFDRNPSIQLLIAKPHDFSFPSGHTAASFAAVSALYFAGERKLWKLAFIIAALIAFSRLYLYVHYPTDVFGGMIVGILSGYVGYRMIDKLARRKTKS